MPAIAEWSIPAMAPPPEAAAPLPDAAALDCGDAADDGEGRLAQPATSAVATSKASAEGPGRFTGTGPGKSGDRRAMLEPIKITNVAPAALVWSPRARSSRPDRPSVSTRHTRRGREGWAIRAAARSDNPVAPCPPRATGTRSRQSRWGATSQSAHAFRQAPDVRAPRRRF